jgi:hypothetical protein
VTPKQFYDGLLTQIYVPVEDMEAARQRRRELQAALEKNVGARIPGTDSFGVGALAQATQIRPLNDVDVVVRTPHALDSWIENPAQAMVDVKSWIEDDIKGVYELSTHAIKITFPDEEFTADVVVGVRHKEQGIHLPHCPKDEPHRWIRSDPARHRDLVLGRNTAFKNYPGRSIFSKQIRILKWWNREQQIRDDQERKPLSSFHVTALALEILRTPAGFEEWTPTFFEAAATLVRSPLQDPSGVGDDIEAKDPDNASALLADAALKTRRALSASESEAEHLLTDVFGDPDERAAIIGKGPVWVTPDGALKGVAVGGSVAKGRAVPTVRSHGDGE